MAYKNGKTTHPSAVCEGATFYLFSKTYGRKIDLDQKVTMFNQTLRDLIEKRAMLYEDARAKALEKVRTVAAPASSAANVIQISTENGEQKADMVGLNADIENSTAYRMEYMRALDARSIANIEDQVNSIALAQRRPIYMEVYLHSVEGVMDDNDVEVKYHHTMGEADKQRFYKEAPAELIDEIFENLADKIDMTENERANFGLPTTGGAQKAGVKAKDGTAPNASSGNSGSSATAA